MNQMREDFMKDNCIFSYLKFHTTQYIFRQLIPIEGTTQGVFFLSQHGPALEHGGTLITLGFSALPTVLSLNRLVSSSTAFSIRYAC